MKRFDRIFLHIGLHKTGSSSLQNFMFMHREELLSELRLLYPSLQANHSQPLVSMFTESPEKYRQNILKGVDTVEAADTYNRQSLSALENEFREAQATRLLLSGEDMSNLSVDSWLRLKAWLEAWTDDIVILCLVRDPMKWSISAAQSDIRGGMTYGEVNQKPTLLKAREKLQKVTDCFGRSSLRVVDFDRAVQEGGGPVAAFAETLELPRSWLAGREESRRNESMSLEAAWLISALNESRPLQSQGKLGEVREAGDIRDILQATEGQPFTLSEDAQRYIADNSAEDIHWLAENFQIELSCTPPQFAARPSAQALPFSDRAVRSLALQLHDKARVRRNNSQLTNLVQKLGSEKEEQLELVAQLTRELADCAGKSEQVDRLQQRLAEIESSASWRITAPLRWIASLLRGQR